MITTRLDSLERALGYQFNDRALLEQALTHKSAGADNNERLEFLGDAVLGMAVAAGLFERAPSLAENDMTVLRASLVRKDSLAEVARALDLGDHLVLGLGERRSGGFDRASILADAFEAVLGAVYIDAGYSEAFDLVSRLFSERIRSVDPDSVKDAKTRLQELLQGRGLPLPDYEVVDASGEDHDRSFTVCCRIAQLDIEAAATARSRRSAEKAAAKLVLAEVARQARAKETT